VFVALQGSWAKRQNYVFVQLIAVEDVSDPQLRERYAAYKQQLVAQGCAGDPVSRPFPSWNRSILTEIYLCHACYCQEILRTETAGQAAAEASLGSFKGEQRRK
jgi:hypothetical protein